jgi:hypothetical protein
VSLLHQAWTADNVGSPDTAHNFGPFTTAAAIVRIIEVHANIALGFAGEDLAPTATLVNGVAWGVQYGAVGYTPLVLPANIGGANFFWSELAGSDSVSGAAWTPPTNDVGWMGSGNATKKWRGQQPVSIFADFYVTVGAVVAGLPAWATVTSLDITFSY